MAGKTYFLLLAAAVLAAQATAPVVRDQIFTVGGKVADPANLRQSLGTSDVKRVNGLDSAVLFTPAKTVLTGASTFVTGTFSTGTQTLAIVARHLTATSYFLFLSGAGLDCWSNGRNWADNTVGAAIPAVAGHITTAAGVSTIVFTVPTSVNVPAGTDFDWNSRALELSTLSRKICIAAVPPGGVPANGAIPTNLFAKWTGATLRSTFDCTVNPTTGCAAYPAASLLGLAANIRQSFNARTVCCPQQQTGTVAWKVGVCINANVQSCCGGSPDGPNVEGVVSPLGALVGVTPVINKCCNKANELLVDDVNPCPCRSENAVITPITPPTAPGLNLDCPADPQGANSRCCLPDPARYPELSKLLGTSTTERIVVETVWGSCFDTTDAVMKCCATGQLYNSGSSRCCVVGGVQPLDVPCSCTTDSHCSGNTRCCTASNPDRPAPREADRCNIYQSYPYNPRQVQARSFGANPTARTDLQNCYGTCINPTFQSCCNGVVCQRAYEKCCNSTCCNKFSETCIEGQRATASPSNTNSFRTTFFTCSSTENLTVLRAGMIYIIPLALLIATFGGLAVVLVFANKASNRSYSFIESTMIVLALVSALASVPLFFSPMFKYAVFIIVASLISILSAAARVQIVNVFAIIGQVLILFYIFDPIHGNRFLTFTSFPQLTGPNAGTPDTETKGLLHTTTSLFYRNGVVDTSFCTNFYDYFNLDAAARDTTRFDNPDINTFGYCKRGWIAFLLIFEGILIVAFVLLFVVSLISLLLRFRKTVNLAPITLEILKEDAPFNPVPLY